MANTLVQPGREMTERKPGPPHGGKPGRRRRLPPNVGTDGRTKVSDEVMHYLVGLGLSGAEIVKALKEDYGVDYSRAGVSYWRKRHNVPVRVRSESLNALVPWRVLVEDQDNRLLRFLLTEARLREGLAVDQPSARRHATVLQELRQTRAVIYYDRENGFVLVPPRPGIDGDFIYDPRFTDDGEPITDRGLWQ